jgi:hypothetical protein
MRDLNRKSRGPSKGAFQEKQHGTSTAAISVAVNSVENPLHVTLQL